MTELVLILVTGDGRSGCKWPWNGYETTLGREQGHTGADMLEKPGACPLHSPSTTAFGCAPEATLTAVTSSTLGF